MPNTAEPATRVAFRKVAALIVLTAALAGCLAGCGRWASDEPGAADLTRRLEGLQITLYLPQLRGSQATSSRYDDELPGVQTRFEGLEEAPVDANWTLTQSRAPRHLSRSICRAINPDNTDEGCRESEGWAYDDYEGDTHVYVLRGATLLVAHVETEDLPELTYDTAQALLTAAAVEPSDLAAP